MNHYIQWLPKVLQHPIFDIRVFAHNSIKLQPFKSQYTSYDSQDIEIPNDTTVDKILWDLGKVSIKISDFVTFRKIHFIPQSLNLETRNYIIYKPTSVANI